MAAKIIISYDDTDNDRDALALGRLLAQTGADVSLAYVRHTPAAERDLEEDAARELLQRGAEALGQSGAQLHVVASASTGEGLWALAERERADVIVFGSEYRTAPGAVRPGTSAQRLLENGPCAVAVAPAGLHERPDVRIRRIGLLADIATGGANGTAQTLAAALGAEVVRATDGPIDLLVVASRPEAAPGRVNISAAAAYAVETATAPVLVVPHSVTVPFGDSSTPPTSTPDPEPAAA
jgi:nucleotide-binding universal stress UspA family protein